MNDVLDFTDKNEIFGCSVDLVTAGDKSSRSYCNLNEEDICIYYSTEKEDFVLKGSSNNPKQKFQEVIRITAFTEKSLVAIHETQDCKHATVYCISPCNPSTAEEMSPNKKIEIFNFEKLFDLLSNECIKFDPSETQLRIFHNVEKITTVTISSRASECLFVSMVASPFDNHYQTLKCDQSTTKGL